MPFNYQERKEIKTTRRELLDQKIRESKLFSEAAEGISNADAAATILYDALYYTERLKALYGRKLQAFADVGRERILYDATFEKEIVPEKEVFIDEVRSAMTQPMKISKAMYKGARPFLRKLTKYGKVRIWTQGDHAGRKAVMDKDGQVVEKYWRGSEEQVKKINASGISRIREKVGAEIFDMIVGEDKFSLLIDKLEQAKREGIEYCFIVEDRMRNLKKAQDTIAKEAESGKDLPVIIPLWIRQGHFKDMYEDISEEDIMEHYHPSFNFDEIIHTIRSMKSITQGKKVLFLVDLDGVSIKDKEYFDLSVATVEKTILKHKWIHL
ncbi:MAG: hypothetical protein ACK4NC_03525 [Candidatus Gracilibacteria bacterium]